ncbi:MAG: hypothetical protein N3A63_08630 [Bacteroidetes bacterium]|nr:hypothetical protein [Bacteroidota bacterium]
MKQRLVIFVIVTFLFVSDVRAQSYAGHQAQGELTTLIDKPTAGMLKRGTFAITSEFFQQGGVLLGIGVGVFEPFSIGISYGGTNILGHEKITMNPWPGVQAKLRILNEDVSVPALTVGFDSQGKELYYPADSLNRYTIKSPGIFVVVSKNYSILGNLSLHAGVNRSFEINDGDKDLNIYLGIEKSLGKDISLLFEYDFATNDNNNQALGKGNGYLNFGFRWSVSKGLVVGVNLKNVVKNQNNIHVGNRTLQLDYVGSF